MTRNYCALNVSAKEITSNDLQPYSEELRRKDE
jgi:hypothetical protein